MDKVAIITMVQAADLPHALTSLASLRMARATEDLHIVLVNDAANPALSRRLAEASGAEIIEAERNLGVAGGRNRLIREAIKRGAEYVLSIDDDILVPPDFVEILKAEFEALARAGANPGVLTAATLDYHRIGGALFSSADGEIIGKGGHVPVLSTQEMRLALGKIVDRSEHRTIYHMGIADWRGAYFYSGASEERVLQRIYDIAPERPSGSRAHLRRARGAWSWIIEGADPVPIDTAPGGVSFYNAAAAERIGFHDEAFNPFGFEDADFSLRLRAAGMQNFCAPRAIAVHDIAARLNERPLAVLRATQGKMAGAFVRKHAAEGEAAPAFFAMARRALDQATDPLSDRGGEGLFARLNGLSAFFVNSILFLLPPNPPTADIFDIAAEVVSALFPKRASTSARRERDFLQIGASNGAEAIVRRIEDRIRITLRKASVPADLLPPLLSAAAGDDDLRFNFDCEMSGYGSGLRIDELSFEAPGVLMASVKGEIDRAKYPDNAVAPLLIERLGVTMRDEGALARVLRLLAAVERLSPAALMQQLETSVSAPSLRRWLRGETATLSFNINGAIDGRPGPVAVDVRFDAVENGATNDSVVSLWSDFTESFKSAQPAASAPVAPRSISVKLKSLAGRLVAEDPAVAPYPDAYDPPKALRLARRARYYSAARGLPLTPNEAKLVKFRNRHRGERAFIIGNGPSLNLVDLSKLKGETTFGVNAIYLNKEKMGFLPTHHIVEDVFVAEDRAAEINALSGPHKWYGHYLRYCLDQTPDVCWLNVACDYRNYPGFPHFSTNASRIVWVGGTVSYIALQLAYHMGFDEVILVGFDHSYTVPKEAMVEGRAITSTSDDPNHFHPDYFGKGYRWHDPRVDRMERAYVNARRAYEATGRRIVNATAGGRLEVFERAEFDSFFPS